jgi:tryptophan halogenase
VNIAIVGGGLAGWLAAITAKRLHPQANVNVFEAPGVGRVELEEATTYQLNIILKAAGLDGLDFVMRAGGTVKGGTLFDNWNNRGSKVFSALCHFDQLNWRNFVDQDLAKLDEELLHIAAIANDTQINDYDYSCLALAGKTPISIIDGKPVARSVVNYHVDTGKLADLVKEVAIERGVRHVAAKIDDVMMNDQGIEALVSGFNVYPCDFVFDCSGLARLILGKHMNPEWVDCTKYFPLDTAMVLSEPRNGREIDAYTTMFAMKHGWMSKMPTQQTIGRWYVYNSTYCTDDMALAEAREQFGDHLENKGVFRFKSGLYKNAWIKNCMALGMAASFFEPMGATNMRTIGSQLILLDEVGGITNDPAKIAHWNERMQLIHRDSLMFVYLRYLVEGRGTPHWDTFKPENAPPELKDVIAALEDGKLSASGRESGRTYLAISLKTVLSTVPNTILSREGLKRRYVELNLEERLWSKRDQIAAAVQAFGEELATNEQLFDLMGVK